MSDLWSRAREVKRSAALPLAARMRPIRLDEFAGQRHIIGDRASTQRTLLRRMIESGRLTSIILHGPPGTGKTTLAGIIAQETGRHFVRENAASIGVKRIREIIDASSRRIEEGRPGSVLLLDEIHRFTKSQQDVLLEDVERGLLTLIGSTTENPMFSVNSALISRSTVFRLEPLDESDIEQLLRRAISDPDRGYGSRPLAVTDEAVRHWAKMCDGDARRALTALEVAVLSSHDETAETPISIDLATAQESIQRKAIVYDRQGDQHYDHASALIKSIRGSDPDAALYWTALMLEAGEDPRFIMRRLAILASEDIGNADPRAMMIAEAAWSLVDRIGLPEARITIGQCVTYLALAPKSNASYRAIDAAIEDVRTGRTQPVPMELRDPNKTESIGSTIEGKGYQYSHSKGDKTSVGGVTEQSYLSVDKRYYQPTEFGMEKLLKERLAEVRRTRHRSQPSA